MDAAQAIDLGRGAIITALLVSAPILLVGLVVGLVIGLLQALTQVQDQTVAFVPKIVAMVAALALCLPWLIERMMEYSHALIVDIPRSLLGG
jgi:flagellar biosynthetic protein FliQ